MDDPIVVRRVQSPLSEETPRYWYGADPYMTHFMNALSSTFPEGEAFFVRSVQHYKSRARSPEQREQIRQFAQQEVIFRIGQVWVIQNIVGPIRLVDLPAQRIHAYLRPFTICTTACAHTGQDNRSQREEAPHNST